MRSGYNEPRVMGHAGAVQSASCSETGAFLSKAIFCGVGYNGSFCSCLATHPDTLTTSDNTVPPNSITLPEVFVGFALDPSYHAPGPVEDRAESDVGLDEPTTYSGFTLEQQAWIESLIRARTSGPAPVSFTSNVTASARGGR